IHVLLFERLFEAENLDEIWRKRKNTAELLPLLQAMTIELATHHVFGIVQHDLHLKNFLVIDRKIYTLDGAQIESFPYLLPKTPSMKNFALFLSQLGTGMQEQQKALFKHYAKARGWLVKEEDIKELFLMIKK